MRSFLLTSLAAAATVSAHAIKLVERADYAATADKPPVDRPDTKYDFVVVGSGPGGGPLAANLAKANYSVLLIEAGDDRGDSLLQQVPAFYQNATADPSQRWDYFVKHYADDKLNDANPSTTWKTSDGKLYVGSKAPSGATKLGAYYPRAGTLGGGSTSDGLAASMPADSDWDAIAQMVGDRTWNSQRMHKFFQKIEHNFYLQNGSEGHGFNGYLGTQQADPSLIDQTQPALSSVLKAAASVAGTSVTDALRKDLNAADAVKTGATGLSGFTAHIDSKGRRVSARTYIADVFNATNPDGSKKYKLDIWVNTLATKVIFKMADNGANSTEEDYGVKPVAIGVEYLQGKSLYSADPRSTKAAGTKGSVYAKREIILSAGVFNTPQLLKLSGVGPADELQKFNIPVLVNSPGVGSNLQDNQEYSVVAASKQGASKSNCNPGASSDPCLADWKNGKGVYTQGPTNAMLIKTSASTDGERDLMVWIQPSVYRGYPAPAQGAADVPANAVSIAMSKIHPRATSGTVKLRSSDPRDTPEINFNFFSNGEAEDLQALSEGVAWGRKVLGGVDGLTELYPCNANSTCGDLKTTIKTDVWSNHAVGTARVGPSNDTQAVLDARFNVRGVRGLRVVDASVFPKIPGAFPILPTFLVAEKATEVILLDIKRHRRLTLRAKCDSGSPKNATKIRIQGAQDLNATIITPTLFANSAI